MSTHYDQPGFADLNSSFFVGAFSSMFFLSTKKGRRPLDDEKKKKLEFTCGGAVKNLTYPFIDIQELRNNYSHTRIYPISCDRQNLEQVYSVTIVS